jgi:menaquinone-dependent protoporphyrinogen oxidase
MRATDLFATLRYRVQQEVVMPSRRILVVYASHYGQTAKVARYIADRLRASGATVLLSSVSDVPHRIPPGSYDGVIVGASVNYGRHQRSIRRFVRTNRDELQRVPSAFFSVSGAECSPIEESRAVARQYIESFVRETGWEPLMTESIAGAMEYTKYSPITRWIIKRISQKEGGPADATRDYEYTNWSQVGRFADRYIGMVTAPEGAAAAATG